MDWCGAYGDGALVMNGGLGKKRKEKRFCYIV
jgi:hypothetical protein